MAPVARRFLEVSIYVWLAYRLHSLKAPALLSWRALKTQFGNGFSQLNNFKTKFLPNLKLALSVYPDARVDDDGTRGIILHPSRPPVNPKALAAR